MNRNYNDTFCTLAWDCSDTFYILADIQQSANSAFQQHDPLSMLGQMWLNSRICRSLEISDDKRGGMWRSRYPEECPMKLGLMPVKFCQWLFTCMGIATLRWHHQHWHSWWALRRGWFWRRWWVHYVLVRCGSQSHRHTSTAETKITKILH